MEVCIAIDPGRDKTGVALVLSDGSLLDKLILESCHIGIYVQRTYEQYQTDGYHVYIACGNGTKHDAVMQCVKEALHQKELSCDIALVDEYNSTQEGKRLYWENEERTLWKKWIPVSWLTPPRPVDDYTAWIIGKRFWKKRSE